MKWFQARRATGKTPPRERGRHETGGNEAVVKQFVVQGAPGTDPVTNWRLIRHSEVHPLDELTGSVIECKLTLRGDGSAWIEVFGYNEQDAHSTWLSAAVAFAGLGLAPDSLAVYDQEAETEQPETPSIVHPGPDDPWLTTSMPLPQWDPAQVSEDGCEAHGGGWCEKCQEIFSDQTQPIRVQEAPTRLDVSNVIELSHIRGTRKEDA